MACLHGSDVENQAVKENGSTCDFDTPTQPIDTRTKIVNIIINETQPCPESLVELLRNNEY